MLHVKGKNILIHALESDVNFVWRHTECSVILLCQCNVYEAIYIFKVCPTCFCF